MQVKVRIGQTVSNIAQRYHTTVDAIAQANNLANPNMIRIGQTLQIPDGKDDPVTKVCPLLPDSLSIASASDLPTTINNGNPVGKPAANAPAANQAANNKRKVANSQAPTFQNKANLSQADIDSLVRAVAAEARGESPKVWAGVAQTIINYSKESGIPIPRLVRSSYLSSNYDGNRVFYRMAASRIPNHAGIRNAVLQAADYKSPVGNRTHFHDTSINTPSFGDRSTRVQIGHIVFYRGKWE